MKMRVGGLLLLWGLSGAALAQRPATTVQLPTFSFFSTATTVSVPDGGSAYLGGINRASDGRNEFGVPLLPLRPFRNSAIGSQRSASSMRVTATIHDFEAMDEFLLNQPTEFRRLQGLQSPAAMLGHTLQPRLPNRSPAWEPSALAGAEASTVATVAEIQARREQQRQSRLTEAEQFYRRAQDAEEAGKASVAKIYYQMAARRATGELKQQALAKVEGLGRAQTGSKLAQNQP
jgi:hypothetical protein